MWIQAFGVWSEGMSRQAVIRRLAIIGIRNSNSLGWRFLAASTRRPHMDVTGESVIDVYEHRERVGGLKFTYEPSDLRFFQARFEPI